MSTDALARSLHHRLVLGQLGVAKGAEALAGHWRRLGHQRRQAGLQLRLCEGIGEGLCEPHRHVRRQPAGTVEAEQTLLGFEDSVTLSDLNRTTLSKRRHDAPLPLLEACAGDIAWLGQQPMRLWPSFDGPGFDPVRSHRQQQLRDASQ